MSGERQGDFLAGPSATPNRADPPAVEDATGQPAPGRPSSTTLPIDPAVVAAFAARGLALLPIPRSLPANVVAELAHSIERADATVKTVQLDEATEFRRRLDMASSLIREARNLAPRQFAAPPHLACQFVGTLMASFQCLIEAAIVFDVGRAGELQRQQHNKDKETQP